MENWSVLWHKNPLKGHLDGIKITSPTQKQVALDYTADDIVGSYVIHQTTAHPRKVIKFESYFRGSR